MKLKLPGARGPIRVYRDDAHIRRLAKADGCLIPMETALARLDGQMTAIATDRACTSSTPSRATRVFRRGTVTTQPICRCCSWSWHRRLAPSTA